MRVVKRSKAQIIADRAHIARRYLEGETQGAIGAELGLSQQQISYDLRCVYRQWIESSLLDFNALQARELARIDRIEAELWERHRAALAEKSINTAKRVSGEKERTETGRRVEQSVGDPRWLGLILQCVAQRARILGLEKQDQTATAIRVLAVHPQQLDAQEWADQFGGRVIEHQTTGQA